MVTKEQMLEAIRALPDDATIDDAMERLYVLEKIDRAMAAARAGETVSQADVRRLAAQWRT